jgi:AraC-like DNA-binding protein
MIQEQKTLKYKGHIVFEKITMSYFHRMPKQFQHNEACFMFINEGEFSVRTPSEFLSFKKGKCLLAKCFDYFFETNKTQRASSEFVDIVGVLLYPEIIQDLFQYDVFSTQIQSSYNIKQIQLNGLLDAFKNSITILLDTPELADEEIIKTKLKEFVLLVSKTQNSATLDFLSSLFSHKKTEFKATIENNLYSNLTINEYAHLCNMSLSTFKRKFQEVYLESPKKHISNRKLLKASEMLKTDTYRVSEIAYDCGFESVSTFNRAFKKHFKKSPSHFKLN